CLRAHGRTAEVLSGSLLVVWPHQLHHRERIDLRTRDQILHADDLTELRVVGGIFARQDTGSSCRSVGDSFRAELGEDPVVAGDTESGRFGLVRVPACHEAMHLASRRSNTRLVGALVPTTGHVDLQCQTKFGVRLVETSYEPLD